MKKIINISDKYRFWENWDLLDGQKRGEVMSRRLFVILTIAYVLFTLVGSSNTKDEVEVVERTVQTVPVVKVKTGDVLNGNEIVIKNGGEVWYVAKEVVIEEEVVEAEEVSSVPALPQMVVVFTQRYNGSKIDREYLTLLWDACGYDEGLLQTVVAISVAETGMGRDVKKVSNFYGWHKGGNTAHDYADKAVMANEICTGIDKAYRGFGSLNPTAWYVYGKDWADLTFEQKYGKTQENVNDGGLQAEIYRYDWAIGEMKL